MVTLASFLAFLAAGPRPLGAETPSVGSAEPTRSASRPLGSPFVETLQLPSRHTQVWSIAQGLDGVLYFGLGDRILIYDGARWRHLPMPRRGPVRSLAVADDGRVYVGANADLGYLARDPTGASSFVSLLDAVAPEDRGFGEVWNTHVTSHGVYFQAHERLLRWTEDGFRSWNPEAVIHQLYAVGDRLFASIPRDGLFELVGEELRLVPGGRALNRQFVVAVLPAAGDDVLVATQRAGFFLLDEGGLEPFVLSDEAWVRASRPYAGLALADGRYAIATQEAGVVLIGPEGRLLQRVGRRHGFPSPAALTLFVDRDDALWVGLDAGVARVEVATPFSQIAEAEGVDGLATAAQVIEDGVALGTTAGVYRSVEARSIDAPMFAKVEGPTGVVFALEVVEGRLMAAAGNGVWEIEGDRATQITREVATALLPSALDEGLLHVGQLVGLRALRLEGEDWVDHGTLDGFQGYVLSIFETDAGDLWVGTRGQGVLRVEGFSVGGESPQRMYAAGVDVPEGFTKIGVVEGRPVFLTQQGLHRYDDQEDRFVPDPFLGPHLAEADRQIEVLEEDAQGRVWVFSSRAEPSVESDAAAGQQVELEILERGQGEPHLAGETRTLQRVGDRSVVALKIEPSGEAWIATTEGFVRYEPSADVQERPSEVLVRRVASGRGAWPLGEGEPVVLDAKDNDVTFEVAMASFVAPARHRFQYRLDGFEEEWSSWTESARRTYTNLPDHDYLLKVRGRDALGRTTGEARLSFRIRAPWYRTPWATALFVTCGLLLLVGGHRLLVRQLQRRKLELERLVEKRTRDLEESETRYRELFDRASDVMFTSDAGGLVFEMNQAGRRLLGWKRGEPRERQPAGIVSLESRLADLVREATASADGEAMITEVELETTEGRRVLFELNSRVERVDGGVQGLETIARDISARREAEERARQVQRMEALGQLAGGVAHDFNNQIQTVLGTCELLELSGVEETTRRSLDSIRLAGEKARDLTKQLLAVGGREIQTPERVDVNRLLEEWSERAGFGQGSSHRLGLDLDPDCGLVRIDPRRLGQVVDALVANARAAMPEGGRIWISTRRLELDEQPAHLAVIPHGVYVTLSVRDAGVGMDRETRERCFEPFFTTQGFGHGAGLGLAAVYGIVRQSGGHVWVESVEGDGSTFVLAFPPAEEPREAVTTGDQGVRPSSLVEGAVLLVEDEPSIRLIVEGVLANAEYEVLVAHGAEEALEILERGPEKVALLLTDVTMPGMSGLELASMVRTRWPEIKIVVMSGYSEEALEKAASWECKDAFIAKPFEVSDLARLVDEVSGRSAV